MIGSLIGWVLFGLIAGFIGRLIHPGRDEMSVGATMFLGIAGSLVGGCIAYLFGLGTEAYEPAGWIFSILGAVLILSAEQLVSRYRQAR
jgi:uncharacterized membrane protein YeaQ/YmgE (transglycosylase-associated protein family)